MRLTLSRRSGLFCLVAMATLTILLPPTHLAAQDKEAKTWPAVPRMPDGHPDLSGVYQGGSTRIGGWLETNTGLGVGGTGAAAPAGGNGAGRNNGQRRPPYQRWVIDLLNKQAKQRNVDSASARCIPSITFTTTGLFPVEFVQTPTKVVILIEYMGVFRNIPLNVKMPDDTVPTYLGNSVGHWEGDTLVVESVDFYEQMDGGRVHSDALRTIERFTRTDYNTIKYQMDWDDPKVLTAPDHNESQFMLRADTRLREYVCNENNQDPEAFERLKKADLITRQ